MSRLSLLVIIIGAIASMAGEIVHAQALTGVLDRQYANIGRNVNEAADVMSEWDYAFRPTDEVRTFGELVGHIANSQY